MCERLEFTGKKLNYSSGAEFFQLKKAIKNLEGYGGPSDTTSR